jgi:hypothetical protein
MARQKPQAVCDFFFCSFYYMYATAQI